MDVIPHLFPVTVDHQRFTPEQAIGKDGYNTRLAVWILSGTVNVAVTQRCVLHAVDLAVVVEIVLPGQLRYAVGRHRTLGRRLRSRKLGRLAVHHTAARHEDDPGSARQAPALQHIIEAGDVHAGVGDRIRNRHSHVDLRGVVVDQVEFPLANQVARGGVRYIHLYEFRARGDVLHPSRRQIVDDPDTVAKLQMGFRHMASHESGAACNQHSATCAGRHFPVLSCVP